MTRYLYCSLLCISSMMPLLGHRTDDNVPHVSLHAEHAERANRLCAFTEELKKQGILDGELLITEGNSRLFHAMSQSVEEHAAKGTPQFMIASLTKQFTAVMLLRALYDSVEGSSEQERCAAVETLLHEPVSKFLAQFHRSYFGSEGHACPLWPAWMDKVTLHHLLSHSSGIPNPIKVLFERDGFYGVQQWCRTTHTLAEQLQLVGNLPLVFEPGTAFFYSNLGYTILAEVITEVTHRPLQKYLERTITKPSGMTGTSWQTKGSWHDSVCSALIPALVYNPHDPESQCTPTSGAYEVANVVGSGNIVSTAQDLARWNRALHRDHKLLPAPLYELLLKPNFYDWGYGIRQKNGVIYCTGKFDAYTSMLIYIPEYDCSIVWLCHIDEDEIAVHEKRQELAKALREEIYDSNKRMDHVIQALDKNKTKRGATRMMEFLWNKFLS